MHFEPEVVESYVAEFCRVLQKGGRAFIHHSNRANLNIKDFRDEPHWRNYMTRELFAYFLRKYGLKVISQDIVGWDDSLVSGQPDAVAGYVKDLDCISVFEKV